jgi:broad specificity phosphatase PhoE
MPKVTTFHASSMVNKEPEFNSTAACSNSSKVTLSLAELESSEHLRDMQTECIPTAMKTKPFKVFAYAVNDPIAPSWSGRSSNDNAVVKIVHFIRHGQAFHNFLADMFSERGLKWKQFDVNSKDNPYNKPELLDAPLTEKGRMQASLLQSTVDSLQQGKPQLIVSSPLCRALSTCSIAFQSLLPSSSGDASSHTTSIPWLCHELVREEHGAHICDRRRSIGDQMRDFPMFDFSLLETDEDALFDAQTRETKKEVAERGYKFLEWLVSRQENHVGVVSHSGWLMTLFNGVVECDKSLKTWFQNGEMRSVLLVFEPRGP